jgi:hypothetical protein
LAFLGLDSHRYDFAGATGLPLRGSSDLLTESSQSLHWDPVERNPQFDPLSRHEHWSAFLQYRYHQVAGEPMQSLGYSAAAPDKVSRVHRLGNQLLNLAWRVKSLLRPWYRRLLKRQRGAK